MERARSLLLGLLRFAAGALVVPAVFGVAAIAGFLLALRALPEIAPRPTEVATAEAPDAGPTFDITREQLDAMLAGEPGAVDRSQPEAPAEPAAAEPAAAEPTAAEPTEAEPTEAEPTEAEPTEPAAGTDGAREVALPRTIALVRLHRPVEANLLDALGCDGLARARDWIWASRGYVFQTAEAQAWFAGEAGYHADPAASLDVIEAQLTDVDQANRNVLTGALRRADCPCPAGRPQRPCPD